ncbi:tubulin polyglutamylase TTLL11 isoform X2 [Latimeria chalumnae]|uniref:tubulin polyglutamylase TTLL11 isoform X2 n=1 Tax=Latimeria chalumnae TaxID=7897 RepID=UPI00313AAA91
MARQAEYLEVFENYIKAKAEMGKKRCQPKPRGLMGGEPAANASLQGKASKARDTVGKAAARSRSKGRAPQPGEPGKSNQAAEEGKAGEPQPEEVVNGRLHPHHQGNQERPEPEGTREDVQGPAGIHQIEPPQSQEGKTAVRRKKEGKAGARRRRRPVTVDISKARTSLEAIKISIEQLRWRECPLGRRLPCDIYWHGVSFHDNENIFSGQVNKFPGMTEMVRKINLSQALRTMQGLFPEEYSFYPRSWILPKEIVLFETEVQLIKSGNNSWNPTFIVKPDVGCQGEGIYLIKDPSDYKKIKKPQVKPAVVQEYISKPLLIDRLKFDIRLYVLLKSLDPLEIYIAKEGLSRFCTEPYQEPNNANLDHVFMHLTNYSLNIHSENFIHSDSVNTGSKRTFSSILYRLYSKGVDIKKLWSNIKSLVIKTIIALIPELKIYHQAVILPGKPGPTCFQILGFDILLMENFKPVLLEVNANPSMKIEHEQEISPGTFQYVPSPVDEEVKVAVIRDTLRLVDPAKKHSSLSQSSENAPEGKTEERSDSGSPEKAENDTGTNMEGSLSLHCLKQVYPKYSKQFNHLRVIERIAELFIRFLGKKGTMKLGPTRFRTFIRKCKLNDSDLSMGTADIMYIDKTRRWETWTTDSKESDLPIHKYNCRESSRDDTEYTWMRKVAVGLSSTPAETHCVEAIV